ncbi:MAG TPA: SDR family NAD(P)-dependent oxidoreductase [Methylomirabilota bacterium]|jgi:3-oxoacyl-[acyl-carrier protein] reductase
MDDLREKVCLVTGASTGIGAAVARALGAQGASVAVHYHRSGDEAQRVTEDIRAAGGQAVLLQGDVSDAAVAARLVADTIATFGRLDVLINNAGGPVRRCDFVETSDAFYDDLMNLNFRSVFATCRAAIPRFRGQGSGTIINTTSVAARHGGGPGALIYAAAKAAVNTLTRGLAKELAPHRIRVNAISPGVVLTPIHERLSSPAIMEAFVRSVPMGRAAAAEECVGAFLFLASERLSSFVTGQVLEVNGGQFMP